MKITKEQLQHSLEKLPDVEKVSVIEDRYRLIATVVSDAFRDQNEAVRQATVYEYLYHAFGESHDALAIIEFIFTNTPEEEAENALFMAGQNSNAPSVQPEHERLVEELAALPESERRAIVQEADEKARRRARAVASWETIERLTGLVSLGGDAVEDCRRVYDR